MCGTKTLQTFSGQKRDNKVGIRISYFSNAVDMLLSELERKYNMWEGIKRAKKKAEAFDDCDDKSAVLLINIYTNSDEIYNAPAETFYQSLNNQLRSRNPGKIWLKYKELLNFALRIIGYEMHDYLFRGERCCHPSVPRTVSEGTCVLVPGFWSTTLDPAETVFFGGEDYLLYMIKEGKGVNIQHIAATDSEREVLIASPSFYLIEKVISCQIEIEREMEQLKLIYPDFDASFFKPKTVIVLKQKQRQQLQ